MYGTIRDPELPDTESKAGRAALPDFRRSYEATVIRTVWYGRKTNTDQGNRIESPEINPYTWSPLISGKRR